MTDKYIEQAPGGELTAPTKTYVLPLSNGSNQDYYAKLLNLYVALGIPNAGQMLNGKISPSVSSNNLTLALVTEAGATPSANDPIYININNTVRKVTAATSITLAAGTNWFGSGGSAFATLEQQYFAYGVWDSADSVVGISPARIPWGRRVSDFNSTTTNEAHLGGYANYTSTDDVAVVGRFAATLSATASFNWSVPAYTNINLIQEPIFETGEMSWAVQYANLTVGNGTSTGKYKIRMRDLSFHAELVWGNTTSISAGVSITLPFTSGSYGASNFAPIGLTRHKDASGGAANSGVVVMNSANTAAITVLDTSGTYAVGTSITGAVPFTWATSDDMEINGNYYL